MTTKQWNMDNREKMRQYRRTWYAKNKTHAKEMVLLRKRKIREYINAYKSERICPCGESDIRCLDFNHLDPSKKSADLARVTSKGWSLKRVQEEIAKCEVICANCHRKKTRS